MKADLSIPWAHISEGTFSHLAAQLHISSMARTHNIFLSCDMAKNNFGISNRKVGGFSTNSKMTAACENANWCQF